MRYFLIKAFMTNYGPVTTHRVAADTLVDAFLSISSEKDFDNIVLTFMGGFSQKDIVRFRSNEKDFIKVLKKIDTDESEGEDYFDVEEHFLKVGKKPKVLVFVSSEREKQIGQLDWLPQTFKSQTIFPLNYTKKHK